MKNINTAGISGRVRAWITRINGKKELVYDSSRNAINASYATDVRDSFNAGMNHALDNLFNGVGAPPNGEDGIAFYDTTSAGWFEMVMDAITETDGVVMIKGTHLCAGANKSIAANPAHVLLGHNWNTTVFTNPIAQVGASWTLQAVNIGETLTIEWTITHAAT